MFASRFLRSVVGQPRLWPILRIPRRINEVLPRRGVPGPARPVDAYCIFRAGNSRFVSETISSLPPDSVVHLHALDAHVPELAQWTRSAGPGERMPLLQGLLKAHPPNAGRGVVILDDDVVFRRRSGAGRFLALAQAGGFDVAQPAHGVISTHSFDLNKVAWLSTARQTRFVEIGPLVYLSPRVLPAVLPLPDHGMGYGLDVRWSGLVDHGYRLGVIDAAPIRHHGRIGAGYHEAAELARLNAALAAVGAESIGDLLVEVGPRWRPWRERPPWDAERSTHLS